MSRKKKSPTDEVGLSITTDKSIIMNSFKISKKVRKIKISGRYVRTFWTENRVPKIIISGQYLKDAGFNIGNEISVNVQNGVLIITTL